MSLYQKLLQTIAKCKKPVVYAKGESGNLHWWMIDPALSAEAVEKVLRESVLPLDKAFKQWCILTERSGGVLLGKSIREFFEWYEQNKYI